MTGLATPAVHPRRVFWLAGVLGFASLLSQILLLRAAGVWLRGNECVIAFVVAAWLGWVALGSLAGHACARRRPLRTAVLTLLLAVVSAVSVLAVLRCYWTFSSVLPGEALDLARSMLLAIVATSLPCFFFGATFGATARACAALGADPSVPTPPTVAWLYVCESIGAMLAGVVATFVLIPLQRWWFALAIVAAAPLMTRPRVLTIAAALALLIGAWHADPRLERVASRCASQFLTGPIVCDLDMPRERLVITRRAGEHAFYFNGRLAGSSMQSEQAEELAWFSLLSARTPRTALLLGFPYNGLAAALLQAGIRVTVVDPDAYRLGALTPFLNAPDRAALTNDMLRVVRDDWRTYASASSQRFDLIIQDTGIPETYALARFFSVEWFALVARLLGSNGALAVVLPGSPGYVPDDLARVLARVRLTMQHGLQPGASNAVRLVPAGATLLIGASAPTPACDAAYYTNALAVSSIKPPLGWFSRALIEDYVSPLRLRQFDTACAAQHVTQPQYDLIPRSYGDAVLYSESRFNSTLHALLARLYGSPVQMRRGLGVAGAILCALVVLLIMRRGASCAAPLLMACASAAGFTLEMLALIRYTLARGTAFYGVGLLFAAFMLGLSLAGMALHYVAAARRRAALSVCLLALAAAAAIVLLAPVPGDAVGATLVCSGLTMVTGAAVGALFTTLALLRRGRGTGIAIYAADVAGAVLAAVLIGVVAPPAVGFLPVVVIVAAPLIVAAGVVAFRRA